MPRQIAPRVAAAASRRRDARWSLSPRSHRGFPTHIPTAARRTRARGPRHPRRASTAVCHPNAHSPTVIATAARRAASSAPAPQRRSLPMSEGGGGLRAGASGPATGLALPFPLQPLAGKLGHSSPARESSVYLDARLSARSGSSAMSSRSPPPSRPIHQSAVNGGSARPSTPRLLPPASTACSMALSGNWRRRARSCLATRSACNSRSSAWALYMATCLLRSPPAPK
mmetsp:Transcript_55527/g.176326  ORF Transcript_55527/g.176326 Transcript_55527/m.176326 type:complete len:228 (+) Transcript_55527:240-923(+)